MNNIKDYLKFMVDFRKKCNYPKDFKYCCFEEFVLENGNFFSNIKKPNWVKRGEIKNCFSNCFIEATRHPYDLTYCEGYAMGVIPVHHAWLLYNGKVIDPTWDGRDIINDKSEYFGVPFSNKYILKVAIETGYYGVIDNFTQNYPLLRGQYEIKNNCICTEEGVTYE